MTWSLRLTNGDLSVRSAQLAVVTGEEKLVQDFRAHLLERMGTDDLHPGYGSLIDGGVRPDGQVVPSLIGTSNPKLAASTIQSEVRRIGADYQSRQIERVRRERLTYNKVTLTAGEILVGIPSIQVTQQQDALFVVVTLATGSGANIDLTVPVSSDTLI